MHALLLVQYTPHVLLLQLPQVMDNVSFREHPCIAACYLHAACAAAATAAGHGQRVI
jgi:hypothetical protein